MDTPIAAFRRAVDLKPSSMEIEDLYLVVAQSGNLSHWTWKNRMSAVPNYRAR
jgi:hypothetical protein